MGLNLLFSRGAVCDDTKPVRTVLGEPNPRHFKLLNTWETARFVVALVHFDGCTEYGGNKLIVYRREVFNRVHAAGVMEPHFLERGDCPLARFAPTPDGFHAAESLIKALEKSK